MRNSQRFLQYMSPRSTSFLRDVSTGWIWLQGCFWLDVVENKLPVIIFDLSETSDFDLDFDLSQISLRVVTMPQHMTYQYRSWKYLPKRGQFLPLNQQRQSTKGTKLKLHALRCQLRYFDFLCQISTSFSHESTTKVCNRVHVLKRLPSILLLRSTYWLVALCHRW